jgi:hypothetical protein
MKVEEFLNVLDVIENLCLDVVQRLVMGNEHETMQVEVFLNVVGDVVENL